MSRLQREKIYYTIFNSELVFSTGLILTFLYILCSDLKIKAGFFAFILVLSFLAGKKIHIIPTVITSISIVLFNLIIPLGPVLFTFFSFEVRKYSLFEGIEKALDFEGVILLSRLSVQSGLKLPFALGEIISRAFIYFDIIMQNKAQFHWKDFFLTLDTMLLDIEAQELTSLPKKNTIKGDFIGKFVVSLSVCIMLILLFSAPFFLKEVF